LIYLSFRKKGIKKIKQPKKKKRLPNIAQKFPKLEIINPTEDITKSIHPIKFRELLLIY